MILHPGAAVALRRLTMNELDVARAMAAGHLTSPQQYQNLWLFAIRITGTGLAYRTSWGEFAWRDPNIYLNDDFIARCNGLPVIWEHPEADILDSKEFENRVIGSVFLPYIQGEDIWAVAKIHDDAAAEVMRTTQLSTSPAVVMREGTRMMLESGDALLIEDHPTLLDHIAICEAGVWDKKGPPNGVKSDDIKGDMKVAERVAADSDDKLDRLLKGFESFSTRMDALEASVDARRRKDEEDDEEKERKACKDSEDSRADEDDGQFEQRMNSEAEAMFNALTKEGKTTVEVAADKVKRFRADKEKWRADRKAAADKARKDAEEDEKKKAADAAAADAAKADEDKDKDEDEDKKKKAADAAHAMADASRRADSEKDLDARIVAALRAQNKPESAEEREAKAEAQARADSVYRDLAVDGGAPPPMQGESSMGYRRRLLKNVQRHSTDWKDIDLHALDIATLPIAERRIYADATAAARNPVDMPDDRLIEIARTDRVTGLRSFEFRGKRTFISGMRRPSARVTSMKTQFNNR